MSIKFRCNPFYTENKCLELTTLPLKIGNIKGRKLFVVDEKVISLYPFLNKRIVDNQPMIKLRADEKTKNYQVVTDLLSRLALLNFSRYDYIVAIGGGIITDIAGLAASIFKRGCGLIFVPTTLVGMIDAAIGGKNGVNFTVNPDNSEVFTAKNLLGSFYPPDKVYIVTDFLNTLTPDNRLDGWAEAIKVSLLLPNNLYKDIIKKLLENDHNGQTESIVLPDKEIIRNCIRLKEKICRNDLYDRSVRRKLNLGHTVAHMIETVTGFEISHGHAVSLGIRTSAKLSLDDERIDKPTFQKIIKPLNMLPFAERLDKKYHLPVKEKALSVIKTDKKNNTQIKDVLFSSFQNTRVVSYDNIDRIVDALLSL